jgi:FixJ family two-component response regulator
MVMGGKSLAIIGRWCQRQPCARTLPAGRRIEPTGFDSAESFLADERRPSFGCVLVDVQLKGMSGLELQPQLLAVGNRTPLIFITAHEDLAAREEAIRHDCAGLFRNIDPGALLVDALRRATAVTGAAP